MDEGTASPLDALTAEQAAALLRQQDTLQTEAAALLAQLNLLQQLRGLGQTELIGSAALGLMVWRDIDLMAEWKIDISFWLADRPRRELAELETTRRHLSAEARVAILWIKEVWHRRPTYRSAVLSVDIYNAVLRHGVRTPSAFERCLRERGKPTP